MQCSLLQPFMTGVDQYEPFSTALTAFNRFWPFLTLLNDVQSLSTVFTHFQPCSIVFPGFHGFAFVLLSATAKRVSISHLRNLDLFCFVLEVYLC